MNHASLSSGPNSDMIMKMCHCIRHKHVGNMQKGDMMNVIVKKHDKFFGVLVDRKRTKSPVMIQWVRRSSEGSLSYVLTPRGSGSI